MANTHSRTHFYVSAFDEGLTELMWIIIQIQFQNGKSDKNT